MINVKKNERWVSIVSPNVLGLLRKQILGESTFTPLQYEPKEGSPPGDQPPRPQALKTDASTAFFVCGMSLCKHQQFKKLGHLFFTLVSRLLMVHDAEEKQYQIEIIFSIQSSPNKNLLRGLHGNRFNKKHEWAPTSTSYKWSLNSYKWPYEL